jgi:hypothetical protein
MVDRTDLGAIDFGRYVVGGHRVHDWLVTLVLASVDGEPGIVEAHLEPWPDGFSAAKFANASRTRFEHLTNAGPPTRRLTTATMRGIPWGAMTADHWEAVRESRLMRSRHPEATIVIGRAGGDDSIGVGSAQELGQVLDAQTAAAYVELAQSGHPRLLEELAERFGLSVSGVRARLARARRGGLLTPARRGVAGGELTDAGCRLIEKASGPPGRTWKVMGSA